MPDHEEDDLKRDHDEELVDRQLPEDDDRDGGADDDSLDEDTFDEDDEDTVDGDSLDEDRGLNQQQFTLGTLFFLVTLACVYFAVESYSGGRFALGMVLVLAVGMPVLYILAWASRLLLDAGLVGTLLWIATVAGLITLGLYLFYGFLT